jgi:hypothetical protein
MVGLEPVKKLKVLERSGVEFQQVPSCVKATKFNILYAFSDLLTKPKL